MLFFLTNGGMELCWLYAWAAFVTIAVTGYPFPFIGLIATFGLAVVVTSLSMGRGWRIIYVVCLQATAFCCAAFEVIYVFYYSSYPIFSKRWLSALFGSSRTSPEWVCLILILVWTLLIWISGVTMTRRPKAYLNVCSRFDIGLAAFFCLFLAKFVLAAKGGVKIDDPLSLPLVFPFFLLAFLAIGTVKAEGRATKGFLPGYQGIGVVISFIAIVLLSAGGLVLFFLPALTMAAKIGYRVVQGGAGLFFPIVVRVVRFIFLGRNVRPEPSGNSVPEEQTWDWFASSKDSWWMEIMGKVMTWGIQGIAAALLLLTSVLLMIFVLKWLFSRTAVSQKHESSSDGPMAWFASLLKVLKLFREKVLGFVRGYRGIVDIYGALLRWGKHSGFPNVASETPLEFGTRLTYHFPRLKNEIDVIINGFNNEVYGQICLSEEQQMQARSAWYTLRSPVLWPQRLKIRFFSTDAR